MKTQAAKFITVIVLLMGALTGCSQPSQTENNTGSGEGTPVQTNLEEKQQVVVSDGNADSETSQADTTNKEVEQVMEEKVFETSGTFVGLIDNHTIEVTVDGVATAFQLSNEVKNQAALLDEGNEIAFTYSEDPSVGQKTIKSFK